MKNAIADGKAADKKLAAHKDQARDIIRRLEGSQVALTARQAARVKLWTTAAQNAIDGRNTPDDWLVLLKAGEALLEEIAGAPAQEAEPVTVAPPALDAEGKLAKWPPNHGTAITDYSAPRPTWLVFQNALSSMPYSGGMGTPLHQGMTVDEAFASLTDYAGRLAETLRHTAKANENTAKELARHRALMHAELDREEMLEEMRQARERQRLEAAARGG